MNMKKKEKCLLFQKRTQRYAQTGQLSKKMLKKIEKKPTKVMFQKVCLDQVFNEQLIQKCNSFSGLLRISFSTF